MRPPAGAALPRDPGERWAGLTMPGGGSPERASVYLHAGQLGAFTQPTSITTILGSCVAVCLWDEGLQVGGINHFLLPHWVGNGLASPRFGNVAMGSLIEHLQVLGCERRALCAKLFGGAFVLAGYAEAREHLGGRNVEVARRILASEGIPVVAEDVGGRRARKLVFHSDDGAVWVQRL